MNPSFPTQKFALELDVFRGIAALMMIVNHAGYRLMSPTDSAPTSLAGAFVYLGCFAPVLFFFSTGFGIALSTRSKSGGGALFPTLWKGMLLILADQLLWQSRGVPIGLDFFAFIGIATIFMTLLSRLNRATEICIVLACLMAGTRYVVGPAIKSMLPDVAFLNWLIGVTGVEHVSYPLIPWMIYPLLGFIIGRNYPTHESTTPKTQENWIRSGAVVALGFFVAAFTLFLLNRVFFRWGTVSLAFFVLSLGVLAMAGSVAQYLSVHSIPAARTMALRGVSSFAVIPLHYALLDGYARILPVPVAQWVYMLLTGTLVVTSFLLARQFGKVATKLGDLSYLTVLVPGLSLLLGLVVWQNMLPFEPRSATAEIYALVGPLIIAGLLAVRPKNGVASLKA